jgi:hypothetical protein
MPLPPLLLQLLGHCVAQHLTSQLLPGKINLIMYTFSPFVFSITTIHDIYLMLKTVNL